MRARLEEYDVWRRQSQRHHHHRLGECHLLEGFGYKSSLMNWKPEILKMEMQR